MTLLTKTKIISSLKNLKSWQYDGSALHKEFTFSTYMDGIEFVQNLALAAEQHNHHPDLAVGWCKVAVTFTSHDQGGVTEKCLFMAREAEKQAGE